MAVITTFVVFLTIISMCRSQEDVLESCSDMQTLENILEKLVRMEFQLKQLEKERDEYQARNGKIHTDVQVAFTAIRRDSTAYKFSTETITFKNLESNIGNAYNPQSGMFVVPVNGTYYFQTSFQANNNKNVIHVYIDLNWTFKVAARSGSQSIILQLTKGDIVTLKGYGGLTMNSGESLAFSGFLILSTVIYLTLNRSTQVFLFEL